jgi:hypothetical protein
MGAIIIKGIAELKAAIDTNVNNIEQAGQYAVGIAALAIERKAKENANTGVRVRVRTGKSYKIVPAQHISGGGLGPNVITGTLRRSITTSIRYGFGTYVATVGPTVEYARAVEMGAPNWKSGVKYPYLAPAYFSLASSGELNRIFTNAFKARLG